MLYTKRKRNRRKGVLWFVERFGFIIVFIGNEKNVKTACKCRDGYRYKECKPKHLI